MAMTPKERLIARGNQACVAYYHRCSDFDDWGTLNEHWMLETEESPAPNYMNRWYTRYRPGMVHDRNNRPGTICVTFLNGEITPDIEWAEKPSGIHAHLLEDYVHADYLIKPAPPLVDEKPAGYGDWA